METRARYALTGLFMLAVIVASFGLPLADGHIKKVTLRGASTWFMWWNGGSGSGGFDLPSKSLGGYRCQFADQAEPVPEVEPLEIVG